MKTFITIEYYTTIYKGVDKLSNLQFKNSNKDFDYYAQFGSDDINNLAIIDLFAGNIYENLSAYYQDAIMRATAIMTEFYIENGTSQSRAKKRAELGSFSSETEYNASDHRFQTAYELAKQVLASAGLYFYNYTDELIEFLQNE